MEIFASLYKELNEFYVDDINPSNVMETGIQAMLNSLDPYTNFIPENKIEEFRTENTGQYAGIGASVANFDGKIKITKVKKDFPAQKNGLLVGDEIISIDGIPLKGLSDDDFDNLMKGQVDTELSMKIKRIGTEEPIELNFTREKVTNKSVSYAGFVSDKIGYVKLDQFTMHCGREMKKSIKTLIQEGAEKLIIDLRDNPGGLLIESVNIVNMFLPKGEEVVSTRGKVESSTNTYYSLNAPLDTEIPLIVLINSGSASASEIVSGTLQDYDRAVIMGSRSYGKGLVQVTRPLSFNSQLKVTTAKYYTPSGRCIQALDYSNRNPDGSVGKVPESLKSPFKTKNGRTVFDGGGINPDIDVADKSYPQIATTLKNSGFILDFVSEYYLQNRDKSIDAGTFTVGDDLYSDFENWLGNKTYSYTTDVEDQIKKLVYNARNEKYFEQLKNETELIQEAIYDRKEEDLKVFKDEIQELLSREIILRYHYEPGVIEHNLKNDPFIEKSLDVFKDPRYYHSILSK